MSTLPAISTTDPGAGAPPTPDEPRALGRSRPYTAADLSQRLRHWHSPRINRWEKLRITAGPLAVECLGASGVVRTTLATGDERWIAPGTRWRVAEMPAGSRFEIGVHADRRGQAEAPQPLRSELLDDAPRVVIANPRELADRIADLGTGERRIVTGGFRVAATAILPSDGTLFWHPLAAQPGRFAVLVARAAQPFELPGYLGRDHAVIEAALGGALEGNAEYDGWLRSVLERHLRIEEQMVFPALLAAGGDDHLVHGLLNEHKFLRQYLGELDDPKGRRKFLRLLDGHDEKEECSVYPDVQARLGNGTRALLARALAWPLPDAGADAA